jgi:hypothetical protein
MDILGGMGHYVPWDGGCLFIGKEVGVVPLHAPYPRTAHGSSGTAAPTASGARRSDPSRARWSVAATERSTRG